MTFVIFFGTCFCFCCCCCCCSCCRRTEKPDETYGKFCAMNFLPPRPTKHQKENRGRRHTELPTLPTSQGQAVNAQQDYNKYTLSKEERERIKKAEEKEQKKEEGEILTRQKDTFGKHLMKQPSEKPKDTASQQRRDKKAREVARKEANEARKKKVEQDKEDRLKEKQKAIEEKQKAKEQKEKEKEEAIIKKQQEEKQKAEGREKELERMKAEKKKKKDDEEKAKKKAEEDAKKAEEKAKKEEEKEKKRKEKEEAKKKADEEKAEKKRIKDEENKKKAEEKAKKDEENAKKKEEEKKKKEEEKKKKEEEKQKKKEEKKEEAAAEVGPTFLEKAKGGIKCTVYQGGTAVPCTLKITGDFVSRDKYTLALAWKASKGKSSGIMTFMNIKSVKAGSSGGEFPSRGAAEAAPDGKVCLTVSGDPFEVAGKQHDTELALKMESK